MDFTKQPIVTHTENQDRLLGGIHCNEDIHLLDFWGEMLMIDQVDITDKQQEWVTFWVKWLAGNLFLYTPPLSVNFLSSKTDKRKKMIQVKYILGLLPLMLIKNGW